MIAGETAHHVETIAAFAMLALAGALVVGVAASWLRIPYSVALLVASLPIQAAQVNTGFSAVVLILFVPALVFEAAWNTHIAILRKVWLPVTVLAAGGVLLTAFTVGFGLSFTHQLPFAAAFIVGASLAATDPIAVIAVFRQIPVPDELKTIVEGESLFNDGLAVVIYGVAVAIAVGTHSTGFSEIGADFTKVLEVAGLGTLVGFALAFILSAVVAQARDNRVVLEVVATIVAAFGSYLIAEHFGASGIFASVVSGLSMRAFEQRTPMQGRAEEVDLTGRFWGVLAFLANALVFLFLGLRVDMPRLWSRPDLIAASFAFVLIGRVVVAYGLLPLTGVGKNLGNRNWLHVVAIAGMRGALSLALVLALPDSMANRGEIIDAVSGVVVVTLIAQGLAIGPLLQRLEL